MVQSYLPHDAFFIFFIARCELLLLEHTELELFYIEMHYSEPL